MIPKMLLSDPYDKAMQMRLDILQFNNKHYSKQL